MTAAQAIATALRASLVGIACIAASLAPAKAADPPSEDASIQQENQDPASAAALSAAREKIRARLDEAERQWEVSKPRSYSYSMSHSHAFTGFDYKISVSDGLCTAKSKDYRRPRAQWQSVSCEGLTISEVFANLRQEWLACPGAYAQVSFDDRYGYIKNVSFDPNTELSDLFWSLSVSRFKARR